MISFYDLFGRKTSVTSATPLPVTSGGAAAGSAPSGAPTLVAGTDSGNVTRTVRTDTTGNIGVTVVNAAGVQGNVASGVADSGNPVKIGAKYNLAAVTFTNGQRTDLQSDANGYLKVVTSGAGTDASGNEIVVGSVASGATDSGNPVKIGGKYNTTQPTFTNGQRGDAQLGLRGAIAVTLFGRDSDQHINAAVENVDNVAPTSNFSSLVVMSRATMWNGTGFDRMRGDSTGGLWTQEKERAFIYAETGGAVAASATLTGASRDAGSAGVVQFGTFRGMVRPGAADGSGTLQIQGSDDTVGWVALGSVAATAGVVTTLSSPVFFRYHRVLFVNGATAGAAVTLRSRYEA